MGLLSDICPIRSPIFVVSTCLAGLLLFVLNGLKSIGSISILSVFLGAMLNGGSIVIVAIECDIGNYVKAKYDVLALGTFAGIIDGFASFGSVIS